MIILLMQALCSVRWYVSNAILGFLAASAGTEQWMQPRLPDPKVGSMHNMQRSQERRRRLCVVVFGAKRETSY